MRRSRKADGHSQDQALPSAKDCREWRGTRTRSNPEAMPGSHLPQREACTLRRSGHRTGGMVLLQVGRALVTPTEGHEYVPMDGAVTVPIGTPDDP